MSLSRGLLATTTCELVTAPHHSTNTCTSLAPVRITHNSWYSHLSSHPLVQSKPSAKAFVDACEKARGTDSPALRQRQWDELKALVEWTRANCK